MDSSLTLRDESSKETHMPIINQETLLGRGAWVESSRVKEPRKTALRVFHSLRFYGDGASFSLSLADHSD